MARVEKIEWNDSDTFEYGERILFLPRAKPDSETFTKFSTDIDLLEDDVNLVRTFNFDIPDGAAKSSSIIPKEEWEALALKYEEFGILPPHPFYYLYTKN